MSDIVLSNSVRQNLLSLQNTADMLARTQNRLATGLKVNSALDNPGSFFTAQSLRSRTDDLSNLLDSMGQSIQTLKAADEGIKSITGLVEAAKAKANQALQTSDIDAREKFATEYNDLLTQIEQLANDADYNGKNLLGGIGGDLSVLFNEDGANKLTIASVDYTDTTGALGITDAAATSAVTAVSGTLDVSSASGAGVATDTLTDGTDGITGLVNGDELTLSDGVNSTTLTVGAGTTYQDLIDAYDTLGGGSAAIAGGDVTFTSTVGNASVASNDAAGTYGTSTGTDYVAAAPAYQAFETDIQIGDAVAELNAALANLRNQASSFGTNLTVVENRQNFTKSMINTLSAGADLLTLADLNEEGANMLALQTRQQLSSTALSLASQADQNVLRLFG